MHSRRTPRPRPPADQRQDPRSHRSDRFAHSDGRNRNAQPIITVTRAEIEKQGFNSVADILQNLTSSGSPAISRADALASGEDVGGYYIDLRNLGAQRTLVLVNGQRLGISTSGLQDLGQIPLSAIERIEVLKDGASSIYGSDAIAGVVNVITRKNFDGAEANAYVGTFDEGDGTKQSYDFTVGATNDRGGVTLSAEYSKEDPVLGGDRWFSKYGNSGKDFPFSGWSLVSLNGVWLGGNCPSGLCTLDKGTDPRDPNNYHDITPAERANPNQVMYVQTGIERKSLFVSSQLDITDTLRFQGDIGYNRRTTNQQIAGYPGQYDFGLLSADSYFNPTPGHGRLLVPPLLGSAAHHREHPRHPARFAGPRRRSELRREAVGLGRRLPVQHQRQQQGRPRRRLYLPSLRAALGPSYLNTATGRVECGTAAAPIAVWQQLGRWPMHPVQPAAAVRPGGPGFAGDPALQTFLFPEYHDIGETKTTVYNANLAGPLFSLPAGDLGLAVGVEHRREDGRFVPDAVNQAGQSTGLSAQITSGSYSLDEAYAELEVPLLADMPVPRN